MSYKIIVNGNQIECDSPEEVLALATSKPAKSSSGTKLSEAQRDEVELLLKKGSLSYPEIAGMFNVSKDVIRRVKKKMAASAALIVPEEKEPIDMKVEEPKEDPNPMKEGVPVKRKDGTTYYRAPRRWKKKPQASSGSSSPKSIFEPVKGQICESCKKFKAAVKCAGCSKMICGFCARRLNGQCQECHSVPA